MIYKKKNGLVCEQIDDEIIVFDTKKEKFYEFDGVASLIWSIMVDYELEDIAKQICDVYDVTKEIAISDISSFFEDLLSNELIEKKGT